MATFSPLVNGIRETSDRDSRNGRKVDRFIVHHAATTSLAAILDLFQPGGREVSANYALGSDGTLIGTVDEAYSAWTSASWYDDRALTIEVANSQAGGSWPVSDAAFDKLARLIADWSIRYGVPINDDTVLTHQELYQRFGESYATACPGDLERRKGELLALANHYRGAAPAGYPTTQGDWFDMATQADLDKSVAKAVSAVIRDSRARLYKRQKTGEYIAFNRNIPVGEKGRVLYANGGRDQVERWYDPYQIVGDSPDQAKVLNESDWATLLKIIDGTDSAYTKAP